MIIPVEYIGKVLIPVQPLLASGVFLKVTKCLGARGGAVGWGTELSRKVAGSISDGVIGIFRPHYGPGVDSASNRNEYQEYFLGGKGGRCVGLTTLPPLCADCLEIWQPHPPGTLRACPGL